MSKPSRMAGRRATGWRGGMIYTQSGRGCTTANGCVYRQRVNFCSRSGQKLKTAKDHINPTPETPTHSGRFLDFGFRGCCCPPPRLDASGALVPVAMVDLTDWSFLRSCCRESNVQ